MRPHRGFVFSLLVAAVLGACNSSTSPDNNSCASFQGTWDAQSLFYTASADPTVTADLKAEGAAVALKVDGSCNFTGTANIPTITDSTVDIDGDFTLEPANLMILTDQTTVGQTLNGTYQYTLAAGKLTLVDPQMEFDFDGAGPNPALPATITIVFLKQ